MINYIKKIFDKQRRMDYLARHGFYRRLSDKEFLNKKYLNVFNCHLNIDNPKKFSEKLQWLKIYDRKEIYTNLVDKYEVKKYVSNIVGEEHIIPTIGVYDNFDDIDFSILPKQFVLKCTHDSGGVIVCTDKSKLDLNNVRKKINKCLKKNYYIQNREWPYKNIKPRVIIEKFMGNNLNDYKIFCFNGNPKYVLVCSNRKGNFKNTDFYYTNWKLAPFTRTNHDNSPNGIEKPKKLKEMIEIAKLLSKNFTFIRVDLYEINGKVYFGELTFYPSSGFEGFKPEEWDKKIGDELLLPIEKE